VSCSLCAGPGGRPVWSYATLRVIRVEDTPGFPVFYRVVWNDHVAELSELDAAQRHRLIDVVAAVEKAVRAVLHPSKMNTASFGNQVPHLHLHVIARFEEDSHFPEPIWALPQRKVSADFLNRLRSALPKLDDAIANAAAAVCHDLPPKAFI
jgi:diadenosine tetraphosphate (Ap4A) HIT family hydrolase